MIWFCSFLYGALLCIRCKSPPPSILPTVFGHHLIGVLLLLCAPPMGLPKLLSPAAHFALLPATPPLLLLPVLLCLLFLSHRPISVVSDSSPAFPAPPCRNIQQACAAQLFFFPPLLSIQETAPDVPLEQRLEEGEEEGSGEGAAVIGDGGWHFVPMSDPLAFPLYDEFVPTTPSYDYNAEPLEMTRIDICACPENDQCSFDVDRTVKFSPQVHVSFCRPLGEVFKSKCKGARSLARVIGTLDRKKFDSLSGVNDTVIFCRCESERWSRVMVEPWRDHFSFTYKCLNSK